MSYHCENQFAATAWKIFRLLIHSGKRCDGSTYLVTIGSPRGGKWRRFNLQCYDGRVVRGKAYTNMQGDFPELSPHITDQVAMLEAANTTRAATTTTKDTPT